MTWWSEVLEVGVGILAQLPLLVHLNLIILRVLSCRLPDLA
jgi:hypothetical protein